MASEAPSGGGAGAGAGAADVLANQPVVLDSGTGAIKAGFAGDDRPQCMFPSIVGCVKHAQLMTSTTLTDKVYYGKKAQEHRGVMRLSHPMTHGAVTNWADMEALWSHVYSDDNLGVNPHSHPVLLTEPALSAKLSREKTAEVFFEHLSVPALYFSPQSVLSLYASGSTTGLVLDSGDGVSSAVPVYEGFAVPHAVQRIDVAGRDVTEYLQLLLRKAGHVFHTSAEMEIVRKMKEDTGYVAFQPSKEEESFEKDKKAVAYILPDGSDMVVGHEQFRAPEVLFQPSLIGLEYDGIHKMLANSVYKADIDLRKTLFGHIVLAGGSTMFQGFADRMLNETRKLAPAESKVRIIAPPDRQMLTWLGGSILASLGTFKTMWLWKSEYNEDGANVVYRHAL